MGMHVFLETKILITRSNYFSEAGGSNVYPQPMFLRNKKKEKKKRSMHFSKRTLFSDIAKYVYYVTDISVPNALIRFLFHPVGEELAQLD